MTERFAATTDVAAQPQLRLTTESRNVENPNVPLSETADGHTCNRLGNACSIILRHEFGEATALPLLCRTGRAAECLAAGKSTKRRSTASCIILIRTIHMPGDYKEMAVIANP